jgi:hypothetical protein
MKLRPFEFLFLKAVNFHKTFRMKKILCVLALISLFGFIPNSKPITQKERDFLVKYMEETRDQILKDVKGLTPAQLNFRVDSTRWSVTQCVEHIALAENGIMSFIQMSLKSPANPAMRDSLKFTDEQVMSGVIDRSKKLQAPDMLKPDGKFSSFQEALDSFLVRRNRNIDYVKTTQNDLRNHFFTTPFGMVDDYQALLLLTGHSKRHTLQLEEVKASPGFPK